MCVDASIVIINDYVLVAAFRVVARAARARGFRGPPLGLRTMMSDWMIERVRKVGSLCLGKRISARGYEWLMTNLGVN